MTTTYAIQTLALVRNPAHFQWALLPLLLLVLHAYNEQAAYKRWNVVLAGLTFWLMDWVNEIINGLIAHASGFAPLWGTPDRSALVLLVGLNAEISLMFAIMGLMAARMLPEDRSLRLFGINNRWWLAVVNSLLCVLVECGLNRIGVLTWAWRGWNAGAPWMIFLVGYLPFFGMAYWVHDMRSRRRQIAVVGGLAGGVAVSLAVFAGALGWI